MSFLKNFQAFTLGTLFWTIGALIYQPVAASAFDFSGWNSVLKKYVRPKTIAGINLNAVDYKNLRKDSDFYRLLVKLENTQLTALNSKNSRMAFWINVYNILAVKMILDNYPVGSIKDLGKLFSPVWKKNAGIIGGIQRTLHEIEHKILRKMDDPRIHSAIVCASLSCPNLRTEAFVKDRLDKQLSDQMKTFLSNPLKGLRIEGNTLYLSSIFKWFKEDFESKGGVRKFLSHFVDNQTKEKIFSRKLETRYLDYDWNLNGS